MNYEYYILLGPIGFGLGIVVALLIRGKSLARKVALANDEALSIKEDAKRKAENLIREARLEAKDRLFTLKNEFEAESKETREEFKKKERRLTQKEEILDRKLENSERRERECIRREKKLQNRENLIEKEEKKYKTLIEEQKLQLEKISSLTADD